jgi:hypothetical protein
MVAFGRFDEEQPVAGSGRVRVALLGELDAGPADKLRAHVLSSAMEVAAAFPRAFAVAPQLVLIPVEGKRGAVPFGLSVRGGGQGILLLVDPTSPAPMFEQSWTLTHEFVHVLHPHLGPDGRWISEGLATYYQNVLRARSGRLTAQEAWDELDAGFERGRADRADLTLTETSEQIDQGRHFMRGYWSGTALMLRADLALRTRKDKPSSLDAALNAFEACCRRDDHDWEVEEFLAALDHGVGGETFVALYRELAPSRDFPDLAAPYRQLGLTHTGERAERDQAAFKVALRMAVMGRE